MPKTLYHYADATGLQGIVTSGKLWATHFAYSNDASEFQYAVKVMEKVVKEATAGAEPESWKGLSLEAWEEKQYESRHSRGSSHDTNKLQHFIACFSKVGDQLSQWRGYGKSIGGYALGFPSQRLLDIEKQINHSQVGKTGDKSNPKVTVVFGRCRYKQQEQEELLK